MNTTDSIIEKFKESKEDMLDISSYPEIPKDLILEDVYSFGMIFRNEEIAINYCLENSKCEDSYKRIYDELHIDDILFMDGDTRSANVHLKNSCDNILTELSNGVFILWSTY